MRTVLTIFLSTLFFIFSNAGFAATSAQNLLPEIILANEDGTLEPPPAVFSFKGVEAVSQIYPKVNIITGEYCEEECDLVVAGIEPLSYRRFYGNQGHTDVVNGHWRVNPECLVVFNFDLTKFDKLHFDTLVGAGERNGNFLLYNKREGQNYTFDPQKQRSFTHRADSGQSHPLNTRVAYQKYEGKDGSSRYTGIIEGGNGDKRFFSTDYQMWPANNQYSGKISSPPYQGYIVEERLPSGNILCYEYYDYNDGKARLKYRMLKSITAFNSTRTKKIGFLEMHYDRANKRHARVVKQINLLGSDGRRAYLFHKAREVQPAQEKKMRPKIDDVVLERVEAVWKPAQCYQYKHEDRHTYFDTCFIYNTTLPEGRALATDYDLESKKVTSQSAPVGPNGEMVPIARYSYDENHTVVWDAENNKILYHFDDDKRVTAIEKYQGEHLYCIQRNKWHAENGNLLEDTLEDHTGKILRRSSYVHDARHNVIEEHVGDEEIQYTLFRSYSDDGFNLKLSETDSSGKYISYAYKPGTNLLTAELVYEGDAIKKRSFYQYDDSAVCVKKIVDDGTTQNSADFSGVTFRRITNVSPRQELPCYGLPEIIEEKTINANGEEILLGKTCFAYHPSGKVLQEDHYDAEDVFRYSIINEYDARELLISTTDALGNRITREYDANHNLIALSGPREDMHTEWVYDLGNRPVEERVWQTDGTILIKKVEYDKLSRPIRITDESGFTTFNSYDALGRITTITHPDGSQEHKEYDILGNVIKETDANGHPTSTEYNFRGQPTKIDHPDGTQELFTYNSEGTLRSYTDKNGALTLFSYDIFNNPLTTQLFSSKEELLKTTSASYSPFNKLSETDAEGTVISSTYDFAGRKTGEKLLAREILYSYDSLGRLIETRNDQTVTIEEHDLLNRVVEKRTEDLFGRIQHKKKFQYDVAGNCTHVTNSRGTTETSYNTSAQPLWIKDPLGFTTTLEYSYEGGQTITTTNPKGVQTKVRHNCRGWEIEKTILNSQEQILHNEAKEYDPCGNLLHVQEDVYQGSTYSSSIHNRWFYGPLGRIEKVIEAEQKQTSYAYDDKGRLQTLIKPDNNQIHHRYDDLDRLTRYFAEDFDYNYSYDKEDRLLSIFDAISQTTTSCIYDDYGNLIQETLAHGLIHTNSYDSYGRRLKHTLPDNTEISYTYHADHLHQVIRNENVYTYAERDLEGFPTLIQLPRSLGQIAIKRDALSRPQNYEAPGYRASFPQNAYDSVGNLCHFSFTDSLGEEELSYAYDDMNQLLTENEHKYAYDSLYNRLSKDEKKCTVNTLCQVTDDGEKSYSYDLCGNLISDGVFTYTYDSLDRLISLSKENLTLLFTYDSFHRRLTKKSLNNTSLPQTHYYLWDGENEIGASLMGKQTIELRILGEGMGAEIGSATLLELEDKSYIPIHDHRGNVVTLLDVKSKEPVESYRYTSFGEQLTQNCLSPWRFSSKRADSETGFVYFGRRYYCPHLGRWITPDPAGFVDSYNLYNYLYNRPLTLSDLQGLSIGDWFQGGWFKDYMLEPGCPTMSAHLDEFWGFTSTFPYLSDFEANSRNKSFHDDLKLPEMRNGGAGFCNGINTTAETAKEYTWMLSSMAGGKNFRYEYNATNGLGRDLTECFINLNHGVLTPPAILMQQEWDRHFDEKPTAPYLQVAHSHGTILARNALTHYSPERRQNIHVVAIAPGAYIPQEICGSVVHYVSEHDFVPWFDVKGRKSCKDTTVILKPHPNANRWDHDFLSPTYRPHLERRIEKFQELIGDR